MGDMMGKVIEISESTSSCSSHSEKEDDSPLKPIFCLKSRIDMKEVEDREDCFILDFDPYEPLDLSKLSMSKDLDHSGAPDLSVIAEKGQVACRDYPHSRHVCVKYPFVQTPHESDCELGFDFGKGMGDMMGKVNEISESTSSCSSQSEKEDDSPLRPIFCLKSRIDMKEVEDREDCFILDFDPYESLDLSKLSMSKDLDHSDAPDFSVIAEKGQVACRDYPHSRHVCVKYPFEQTPHESYCELCYCYVCDLAAPCKSWAGQTNAHCNAIDSEAWKVQRKLMRGPTPKFEN